jgi:RNA polymerase sigma-70 factor (ECF subfamily)
MRELQQGLIFFLQSYVHSYESAEDLAEETFVELLVHKGRFRGQSSLKTYLFSVARHKAIDFIRKEQRRPVVGLGEITERVSEEPGPEEVLQSQERSQVIANAIQGLPQEYREVLRLLYLERLHYDEIAQIMKKNKKQIDNLAYRARASLRTALGKEANFIEGL